MQAEQTERLFSASLALPVSRVGRASVVVDRTTKWWALHRAPISPPRRQLRGTQEKEETMASALLGRALTALRGSSIPDALPEDLGEALALLSRQPSGVAESVIASMRYGSRVALESCGVIEEVPPSPDQGGEVMITSKGWRIIEACAEEHAPSASTERRSKEEVERAREEWTAQANHTRATDT